MNQDPIRSKIEENHRLLEQMHTVLGRRWVYRFLRLYGFVSEWLHTGLRNKCTMIGSWIKRLFGIYTPPQTDRTYRFAENLSAWTAQSHRNLDEIRRWIDAMPQSDLPHCDDFEDAVNEAANDAAHDAVASALGETGSLCRPEEQFLLFKQEWLRCHAAPLPQIQTACEKGLVSVILPVFNGEDLVSESIESVLAQQYPHIELIIVDDGSTDGTPALVDAFAARDSRVHVLHQANQKLPGALNAGFRVARGEFFTWTSADNLMHPDCLARLVAELQQYPQTAMVYANLRLIDETGAPNTEKGWYADPVHPEHVILPECVLKLNTVSDNYIGAAFLYRASAASALGGYSPNRFGIEDYDFWLRMNECFELRHTAFRAPVYDYRFHSKSLTARNKQLNLMEKSRRTTQWDVFRRQYLPGPAFWRLDDAAAESTWGRELAAYIRQAGHVLIPDGPAWQGLCKNPSLTTIELRAGLGPADMRMERPAGTETDPEAAPVCRAFVGAEAYPVPDAVSDMPYDAYISLSPVTGKDLIPGHRGWFHFDTMQALFVFLDIRAKNTCLLQMETVSDQMPFPDHRQGEGYRTKYTRHWITPEGNLDSVKPIEWLSGQLADDPVWVSVIIPVCGVLPHPDGCAGSIVPQALPQPDRCIGSIVRQTVQPIEILLVDDTCDCESGVLFGRCDDWAAKDSRIRVIHFEGAGNPAAGISTARNAGINGARGKYLAFVDPDDWIEPNMLEKLLFAAEACNAGIAECGCEHIFSNRTEKDAVSGRGWLIAGPRRALLEEVYEGRFKSIAWNKLYRRELFAEDIRYPAGKCCGDEFLTHRLLYKADRLVSVEDVLYHRDHIRRGAITGQAFYTCSADEIEALRAHARFLKEHGEQGLYPVLLNRYAEKAAEFLEQCWKEKMRGKQAETIRAWLLDDREECAAYGVHCDLRF